MRLLHPGNCLRFLKYSRISPRNPGTLGSLNLTTGSPRYYSNSKCKQHPNNTCFGFTHICPLFQKWKSSHLGLLKGSSNSVSNYSTEGKGTDDLGKDTIVKEILKDIQDDFETEFKSFVAEELQEETNNVVEQQKSEMKIENGQNSLSEEEIDDVNLGIILSSSSSSIEKEGEELVLIEEEEEEEDEDIEDFIDYGYTIDDDRDMDIEVYSPPIELKRGTTGVFDIEDLVTVLEDENGIDLCVIDVPESKKYVDYMVIVSGKSARHIRSMGENVKWLYKQKKHKSDPFVQIEGLNTNNWLAMDLGNIALHIFLPQVREKYDLETLWTIGDVPDDASLDDPYAMKEMPSQEVNEEVIQDLEASRGSPEPKGEENSERIQNLSNKH